MNKIFFPLTKKEYRDLKKENKVVVSKQRHGIFLLAATAKVIKGKLGFTVKLNDEKFLAKSEAIYTALFENKNGFYTVVFTNLPMLATQNVQLGKKIAAIKQGGLGLEGAKNTIKNNVFNILMEALNYINNMSRIDQTNAVNIITGCTMLVNKEGTFNKQDFAVKQAKATGSIKLESLAVKINGKYVKTTYMWQFSIDDGKTWEDLDPTLKSKTIATGMLVGIETWFRKRTKTSEEGMSAWCNYISIVPQ